MKRNLPMMTFEKAGNVFTATNSIKRVIINKQHDGKFALYTPEGGLLDEFTSRGPFVSFDAAKRNAEMNVGMKIFAGI
jgi:hypothetical protein